MNREVWPRQSYRLAPRPDYVPRRDRQGARYAGDWGARNASGDPLAHARGSETGGRYALAYARAERVDEIPKAMCFLRNDD
jgi:hypothetical protein